MLTWSARFGWALFGFVAAQLVAAIMFSSNSFVCGMVFAGLRAGWW